ncbi:CapA family protein [Alkalibacterium sp. f15]|uniref:CapA family protein n=1 Tax=Alkalibacterium sp. f15 TaxID=3414029 RepID=UPI003BF7CF61
MRSNNRRSNKNTVIILALIALVVVLMGAGIYAWANPFQNGQETVETNEEVDQDSGDTAEEEPNNNGETSDSDEDEQEPEETFIDIRISAVGDVMGHLSQLIGAHDAQTDTYDFNPVFEDVKPFIEEADLALANLETTLAGSSRPYSGYPLFNAPDELADALKYAGFDTIVTSNNHSLDTRDEGLRRTAEVVKDRGMDVVGTYETAPDPDERFLIKDVKGIKVAILAYTEHTNGLDAQYSAEEVHSMINIIDEAQMVKDIENAKAHDPDIIVAYTHWGNEYTRDPNEFQTTNAEILAREGVDIIFGGHPHVIHEAEFIEVDGNEAFVIYSLGNIYSNQRKETLGEGFEPTEDGVIASVDIQKNEQTGETTIKGVDFVPTWMYRHSDTGGAPYTYRILPIEAHLEDTTVQESYKERMRKSYEETMDRINMPNSENE